MVRVSGVRWWLIIGLGGLAVASAACEISPEEKALQACSVLCSCMEAPLPAVQDRCIAQTEIQALGPFLNPLEMNNASKRAVIDKIAAARYAPLFRQQFGANIFNDTETAYAQIGVAIAAFERVALQPFIDHQLAAEASRLGKPSRTRRGRGRCVEPTGRLLRFWG